MVTPMDSSKNLSPFEGLKLGDHVVNNLFKVGDRPLSEKDVTDFFAANEQRVTQAAANVAQYFTAALYNSSVPREMADNFMAAIQPDKDFGKHDVVWKAMADQHNSRKNSITPDVSFA